MTSFCLFGAGRIGQIHGGNVAANPRSELRYVVDVDAAKAKALADRCGAEVADAATALGDPKVDAVIIGSPTETHAPLIEAACAAGKAIFCEKPVDLSLARVQAVVKVVEKARGPVLVAFNRRFDPNFSHLHRAIDEGRIGKVELVAITSRDPGLPPLDYLRGSGGLFRDMMIHDLDMARWLLGEEPTEVYAVGSCLVDAQVAQVGDVDTAVVTLKTRSGAIAQISNSRRAVYGYDQRIEVFGSGGMLRANNVTENTVELTNGDGSTTAKPLHFFLERYMSAYRHELEHFLDCVEGKKKPIVGIQDGMLALKLADAAVDSVKSGKPVKV
jgi:myo-inositol 2-dehydrogenase/D-chiro-inositol 1-dehydrogenase